jgi:hypothetical protein
VPEAAQAKPERKKPIIAEKNGFGLLCASGLECPRAKGLLLVLAARLESASFKGVYIPPGGARHAAT